MGSVTVTVDLEADVATVWAVVRDFEHPDRLAPGFVDRVEVDRGERIVTFAGGGEVREIEVARDDDGRRLSYAAVRGRSTHHNASMQVLDSTAGSRLVWTTDFLPDDLSGYIDANMRTGAAAIRRSFAAGGSTGRSGDVS